MSEVPKVLPRGSVARREVARSPSPALPPRSWARCGIAGACLLLTSTAWSEPSAATTKGSPPGRAPLPARTPKITPKAVETAEPPPPPPRLSLSINPRDDAPWAVEVLNEDDRNVRLVADTRLLRFEVRPVSGPSFWCQLPASMRSTERVLELQPGTRWVEPFDIRLFCLDQALPKGSTVVAHLGWEPPKPKPGRKAPKVAGREQPPDPKPPFVATILAGSHGTKDLEAPAVTLHAAVDPSEALASDRARDPRRPRTASGSRPSSTASAPPRSSGNDAAPRESSSGEGAATDASAGGREARGSSDEAGRPSTLEASPGRALSVHDVRGAAVTITLRNTSSEAVDVYARPQLISAIVVGPTSRFECKGQTLTPAPLIDFVTRLRPGEAYNGSSLLERLCPAHAFDRPGLYFVFPTLRAPKIPLRPRSASGAFTAEKPQLLRIEAGAVPFNARPPEASKAR